MKFTALKLAAVAILLAVLGHLSRYDVVPTGQGAAAYRLDRLTGKITFMHGSEEQAVRDTLKELAAAADADLAKARSKGFSDYEIEQSLRQHLKQKNVEQSGARTETHPKAGDAPYRAAPADGSGMKLVEIPDVGVVGFPADMTDEQITKALEHGILPRK